MDPFANKAWLAKLMYGRGGPNGLRTASKFYISGWERPSQVIAAVRTVSESADDVIVFPLRELSQVEIIAHKLVVRQTKEVQNGDARPDNASPPVFEGSGGQHVSSLKENQKPIRQTPASEHEKPKTEVRGGYWRWWAWPKSWCRAPGDQPTEHKQSPDPSRETERRRRRLPLWHD